LIGHWRRSHCRSTDDALHHQTPARPPSLRAFAVAVSLYVALSFGRVAGCAVDRAVASRA
jgi:hypothetical protein